MLLWINENIIYLYLLAFAVTEKHLMMIYDKPKLVVVQWKIKNKI